MEYEIAQVARRIRELRDILGYSVSEMAQTLSCTEEEYVAGERGESDFSFTFLYKCAKKFGVDIAELVTGEVPKLSFYTITRSGEGMPIERRAEFQYQHLGYRLKNKPAECFRVIAKYDPQAQDRPIPVSTHSGYEFDYVLEGSLKVRLDEHIEILHAGDCVYYDSSHKHGLIAIDGKDCVLLAIVIGE